MSKERFEWLYNETMLKHYMVDNQNNIQLGYEAIVNLLNQQNKQIADLEAKLANIEESARAVIDANFRIAEEREKLKQQLAEKEKEIENIKLCKCVNCTNEYEFMLEGLVEDLEKQIDKDNQDKISFAVEQLEKVKEFCNNPLIQNVYGNIPEFRVENFIDNQIKQLKEMK